MYQRFPLLTFSRFKAIPLWGKLYEAKVREMSNYAEHWFRFQSWQCEDLKAKWRKRKTQRRVERYEKIAVVMWRNVPPLLMLDGVSR